MIGVYDSGFGGLTVLRHLVDRLPRRDFLYLGDSGRAPYGGRDAHTILDFAEQCVEHLFDAGCRLVVVACHTVSCVALRHLQRRYGGGASPYGDRRVLGVTIPAAEAAVAGTRGRIGVLATQRTVQSRTFVAELAKLGREDVVQRAAPLLAPLVEEGWEDTDVARAACARYLADLAGCEAIILGCTHYPLLSGVISYVIGDDVSLVSSAEECAREAFANLTDLGLLHTEPRTPRLRFLTTGSPELFEGVGRRLLGGFVTEVEQVYTVA